jgi:hypothetical protein
MNQTEKDKYHRVPLAWDSRIGKLKEVEKYKRG